MRLVQKISISLSIVGLLAMSSCSEKDTEAVEPEMNVNSSSNTKLNALQPILLPYFPSTYGNTGLEVFPQQWQRGSYPAAEDGLYNGTSSRTHLWGDASLPWTKPLLSIPEAPNANSFFTLISDTEIYPLNIWGGKSLASTTIQHLKPGKVYEIKFCVATTILPVPGFQAVYAKTIRVAENQLKFYKNIDLTDKEAEWVPVSIKFLATDTSHIINFHSEDLGTSGNKYSFTHIFVSNNAIKLVE